MKTLKTIFFTLVALLICVSANAQFFVSEIVYDGCNASTLSDANAEYFVLCDSGMAGVDLSGVEWDDDGDCTDGDGSIFPTGTMIPPGGCLLVYSAPTLADWIAEYGPLTAQASYASADWESLNNTGDNLCIGGLAAPYPDLVGDGENIVSDGMGGFVAGDVVSIPCGAMIIPTAGTWGLICLSLSFISFGLISLHRKERIVVERA